MNEKYTAEYFDSFKFSSRASAEVVVPVVREWVKPKTVVDFGCGLGMWLSVWEEAGCDVRGVDGDWVDREQMAIAPNRFTAHDLSSPIQLDRQFDLAMSVEAAEHLMPESASGFVESLTRAAPVVLFSASIPNQPGEDHVNCQWPSYWADLFLARDYVVIDSLRYMIWADSRVDWWYRQNIMMYVARSRLTDYPALATLYRKDAQPLSLVHPELMQTWHDWGMQQSRLYWELQSRLEGEADAR